MNKRLVDVRGAQGDRFRYLIKGREMTKYCKGCVYHNKGMAGTKSADWCCRHGNVAKKYRSICILQSTKKLWESDKGEMK